ncbi:uncharacterized protein J4E87_005172 [Alternaria ethzedia]|uniref:uncharacterized protein n=1 Tax=Alternaria metachromatica TaxID=283354 RepID=UPI0020C275DB|nr:uncharacterized protein J4E83_006658 [Alternaria metachromatica]XP_049197116.1 uncharacterized protein J4E93_007684 [Alternaria ventricosa]XP_049211509.1 uncharacterized protein J4E79_005010 [Alternaria viburni]XP_049222633.1 uncharacterized protein J4E78_005297 [Alternaria triticimaculans]XP_049233644.1 uncharacterized protein J4E87_005172 [Alternaria ethzedia]XP_049243881.1 uncharacterized protein J4E84_005743 [Alternaria hordeiaustralica]KAI4609054.1 hypothetical protein J4E80_008801 [A
MLVSIISVLAAATAVAAQGTPAPVVMGNPMGAKYVGTLPAKEGSALTGSIEATTGADGKGVKFQVSFAGLPETGGPFMYHLHAKPVPSDGNCTGTGAHLDPYMRGEAPPCDATKPETCQTGDLSGKYGNATETTFSAEYTDLYSATLPSDPAFFGALSFVVHLSNKTRIGCANFTMVSAGEGEGYPAASSSAAMSSAPAMSSGYAMPPTTASSGFAMPSGSPAYNATSTGMMSPTTGMPIPPSSASASAPAEFSGAAVKVAGGAGALLAAAAALVL